MSTSLQHSAFVIGMFHLLHFDDLRLLQDFHCIEALVVLALDQMHPTKRTRTQRSADGKVVKRVFALCFSHRIAARFLHGRNVDRRYMTAISVPAGIARVVLLVRCVRSGVIWLMNQVLY